MTFSKLNFVQNKFHAAKSVAKDQVQKSYLKTPKLRPKSARLEKPQVGREQGFSMRLNFCMDAG